MIIQLHDTETLVLGHQDTTPPIEVYLHIRSRDL